MPTEWLSEGFKIIAQFANDGNIRVMQHNLWTKNREFET